MDKFSCLLHTPQGEKKGDENKNPNEREEQIREKRCKISQEMRGCGRGASTATGYRKNKGNRRSIFSFLLCVVIFYLTQA